MSFQKFERYRQTETVVSADMTVYNATFAGNSNNSLHFFIIDEIIRYAPDIQFRFGEYPAVIDIRVPAASYQIVNWIVYLFIVCCFLQTFTVFQHWTYSTRHVLYVEIISK